MISGPMGRVWVLILWACLCVAGLQVGLVLVHPDRPRRTVEVASDRLKTTMDMASDVRGLPGVTSVVLPRRNLTSAHRRQ